MNKSFEDSWKSNQNYFDMLSLISKLSVLFSDSETPYLHYRISENLFCKYYNAENLSRTDTAYDAKIGSLGIGIKTFILKSGRSVEKIAEFNALSSQLKKFSGKGLAIELGRCRNERMEVANRIYDINDSVYHIIGRTENKLEIFNTPYEFVDINNIQITKDDKKSLHFNDGKNSYVFNWSKSVLMKKFIEPKEVVHIPIEILKDPYILLETLLSPKHNIIQLQKEKREKVILPLYSTRDTNKNVPEKSGLNQWNAKGRPRHEDEVYIPVPVEIHNNRPNFFPERDIPFNLRLPDGKILSAKMCQENRKGLMSNPNKELGNWILRKVLRLKPDTLVTRDILNKAGFDSLVVYKNSELDYSIDVCYSESYSDYQD